MDFLIIDLFGFLKSQDSVAQTVPCFPAQLLAAWRQGHTNSWW